MRLAILAIALAVSACATAPEPAPAEPQTRAQALAALLVSTDANAPARVMAAEAEMAALEAALTRSAANPIDPVDPVPDLVAAPNLNGARSVLSAVHVASYREFTHAARGWRQLTERHAVLSGRSARLERVDLGERGVFLRLKAGPFDTPEAAATACAAIRSAGDWCAVTGFGGDPL